MAKSNSANTYFYNGCIGSTAKTTHIIHKKPSSTLLPSHQQSSDEELEAEDEEEDDLGKDRAIELTQREIKWDEEESNEENDDDDESSPDFKRRKPNSTTSTSDNHAQLPTPASTMKQATLSKYFIPRSGLPPSMESILPSDKSGLWTFQGRSFMPGDTWRSKNHELLKPYYIRITRREKFKALVHSVHMDLKDTFLGEKWSQELVQHRKDQGIEFPNMVQFVSLAKILDKGRIPLRNLDSLYLSLSNGGTIASNLYYESVMENGNGLNIAYRIQCDQKKRISLRIQNQESLKRMQDVEVWGLG